MGSPTPVPRCLRSTEHGSYRGVGPPGAGSTTSQCPAIRPSRARRTRERVSVHASTFNVASGKCYRQRASSTASGTGALGTRCRRVGDQFGKRLGSRSGYVRMMRPATPISAASAFSRREQTRSPIPAPAAFRSAAQIHRAMAPNWEPPRYWPHRGRCRSRGHRARAMVFDGNCQSATASTRKSLPVGQLGIEYRQSLGGLRSPQRDGAHTLGASGDPIFTCRSPQAADL